VDPRSTVHNRPNELEPPSLKDVSECLSQDIIWGDAAVELHDVSTDLVRDCINSVSDASQNVTDESVMRCFPFPDFSLSSGVSTPLVDEEPRIQSPTPNSSQTTSPPSTVTGPISSKLTSLIPSPRIANYWPTTSGSVVPLPLPDGHFKCSKCPRTFAALVKAR